MRIAFNLTGLVSLERDQSQWVFSKNLLKALIREKKYSWIIITPKGSSLPKEIKDAFEIREIGAPLFFKTRFGNIFFQQLVLPFYLKNYDLIFNPAPNFPILVGFKSIVVVHDCVYKRFKDEAGFLARSYLKCMYLLASLMTKKIIAVSEFTKRELVDLYDVDKGKVVVIHEGPPDMPKIDPQKVKDVRSEFNIVGDYYFYIGSIRARKNLIRLLEGFAKLNSDTKLVLAGKMDKRFINLKKEIDRLDLKTRVIEVGRITDEQKVALYTDAKVFISPSLYEGFGLPILEAQSLGIPIVAADIAPFREVAGESVVYINPKDSNDITSGLIKMDDTKMTVKYSKLGKENCLKFSWQNTAENINLVINEIIAGK